jgi:deazaflavin-dependent oxidoreductase (nitroreductase family)
VSVYGAFSKRLVRHAPGVARLMSQAHTAAIRASGGRLTPRFMGMPLLTMTTVGRKTGKQRETPMLFMRDGDDYVVVASNAGADRPPAWYFNATAAGRARVSVRGQAEAVTVREATATERERLWPELDAQYAGFGQYRSWTSRDIPILVLTPVSG